MKKYAFLLLAATLTLAACGKNEQIAESTTTEVESYAGVESTEAEPEQSEASAEGQEENMEETIQPLIPLNIELSAKYEGEWDDKGPIITADSATIHILDDGYETLKDVLDSYNERNWQEVYSMYLEQREYAKEDVFPEGTELFISREIEVTRADEKILSFINAEHASMGGAHDSYYENAEVFDVESGKSLELSEVVKDYDQVYEFVIDSLEANYEKEMFFDGYGEWLYEMFYEPEGAMTFPIEWSMDMDGIEFRFNPYVIGPWISGIFKVEIPYEGHEDWFEEEYLPVLAGGRIRKVEPEERMEIDTDRNGENEVVYFSVSEMTEDYQTPLELVWNKEPEMDGDSHTKTVKYYGSFVDAYLVEVPDEINDGEVYRYLYVEYLSDNDFRRMYIIDLNQSEIGERELFDEIGDIDASVYGHVAADSGQVALYSRIYTLGTYMGYKTYAVEEDGMPETEENMYNLISYGFLTSKRELTVLMHKDGGGEKEEVKLPKGTSFRPRKTDGKTVMEMELEDGRRCDLPLEKADDDYQYFINGVSEYDCFETLPYAG